MSKAFFVIQFPWIWFLLKSNEKSKFWVVNLSMKILKNYCREVQLWKLLVLKSLQFDYLAKVFDFFFVSIVRLIDPFVKNSKTSKLSSNYGSYLILGARSDLTWGCTGVKMKGSTVGLKKHIFSTERKIVIGHSNFWYFEVLLNFMLGWEDMKLEIFSKY